MARKAEIYPRVVSLDRCAYGLRAIDHVDQSAVGVRRSVGNRQDVGTIVCIQSKRCAVVGHVNKTEEIRYQNTRLIGTDESQDHLLGPLIQCVQRKRKEKDELHAG